MQCRFIVCVSFKHAFGAFFFDFVILEIGAIICLRKMQASIGKSRIMVSPKENNNSPKAILMGIGLDNKDGHKRITKGDNFYLAGGSEETHDKMTETAIKVNEKLDAKGKRLEDVSKEEFIDIISEARDNG